MSTRTFLSVGEVRAHLLRLFEPNRALDLLVAGPAHLGAFAGMSGMHTQPTGLVSRTDAYAFRRALLDTLANEIDALPQTLEWESIIHDWCDALECGEARCFHFARTPLFTRLISTPDSTVICPAPITEKTIDSQQELNIELNGAEHTRARAWFSNRLAGSEEISEELRRALLESWAGAPISPSDLYYKVLTRYFWATIEGLDLKADDNPILGQLTEFQLEAYQYAKGIIRRYGGVFLADVVGLGKTFIALALLRHLQDRYGEHAVVIAPPNVMPAWKALAAEFRVELQPVSIGKLDDLNQFSDREVVVIDESHNFRNIGTQRYERIQSWLRPNGAPSERKVLLLSATPQNNDPLDVKHQLAFFPDNYMRLPYRGESMDAWFSQVRTKHASLTELLQHVVVRRTRRFIQAAYPDATLRVRKDDGTHEHIPLQFPERRSGADQCLRYVINETYEGDLYGQIMSVLSELAYTPYCLSDYLTHAGQQDHRVAGIRRAGTSIRGLFKVLLLKRLESSVVAFKATAERYQSRLKACLTTLDDGLVKVRIREQARTSSDDDTSDLHAEERDVPARLFSVERLRRDLDSDLQAISKMVEQVACIDESRDVKVSRLASYLEKRPPTEHRTIVFTQFADTAEHVGRQLSDRFGRTEVVTGSKGNVMGFARRFSPKSNRYALPPEQEIDLLISTDALSEGVNLQDADTLINYDLHWNPVRLIQRAGRIDRIGSDNEVINIASFLPEAGLESELGLEAVLRRRIDEFLKVFGEDSHILPSDEVLDPATAATAFSGEALEEQEDDMDGLSRHVERLLQLRRKQPAEYNRILTIRPGRHAVSSSNLPGLAATRLGWYWRFWTNESLTEPTTIDDLRGLDLLFAHAEAGERKIRSQDSRSLGAFIDHVRSEFEPLAELFKEQRLQPRLTPPETYVLERLESYKRVCIASRRDHVEELIAWVRQGYGQIQLRRLGRIWKREGLPAETVFNETRVLYSRFPVVKEDLGEAEVVGAVFGLDTSDEA